MDFSKTILNDFQKKTIYNTLKGYDIAAILAEQVFGDQLSYNYLFYYKGFLHIAWIPYSYKILNHEDLNNKEFSLDDFINYSKISIDTKITSIENVYEDYDISNKASVKLFCSFLHNLILEQVQIFNNYNLIERNSICDTHFKNLRSKIFNFLIEGVEPIKIHHIIFSDFGLDFEKLILATINCKTISKL